MQNQTNRKQICVLVVLAVLSGIACGPTFAPPARTIHGGAPGKFKAEQMEIGGAATAVPGEGIIGHGEVDYAPTDWLLLEAGVDALVVSDPYVMGYVGAKFAPYPITKQSTKIKLLLDLELGGAAGAGGVDCRNSCSDDGLSWNERFAGGGYAGLGLGMNVAWFDLYARTRGQYTNGRDVPSTFWYSAVGGMQVTIVDRVKLYTAHGIGLYDNEVDGLAGYVGEFGLNVLFDLTD